MPKIDADWVGARVNEALKAAPVATGVADTITEKLKGSLRERALRAAELNDVAKTLLAIPTDDAVEKPE